MKTTACILATILLSACAGSDQPRRGVRGLSITQIGLFTIANGNSLLPEPEREFPQVPTRQQIDIRINDTRRP